MGQTRALSAHSIRSIGTIVFLQLLTVIVADCLLGGIESDLISTKRVVRVLELFLAFFIVHKFSEKLVPMLGQRRCRDTIMEYLIFILSLGLIGFSKVVTLGLINYTGSNAFSHLFSENALFYAIPYCVGILVTQVVLGRWPSMVMSILTAMTVAFYASDRVEAFPFVLSCCLVGSVSLSRCRSRSAYLQAGWNIALVGLPFSVAALLLQSSVSYPAAFVFIAGPIVSGILAAFLAAGVTPLFEHLGGYASDMRLIEMATLDHPLLKELSVQAPGTWNHSMVMGMMVESAADAVGANPVVCRVGAYFHDIGKVKKPLYFVENQEQGDNRHDKLSPSMSALIIRSHVKDGVELAHRHKVPMVIEEMIPQHHGTSQIEFFYEKARREAEEAGEDPETVDISLYTYPGPKPQTREAGILMLADGIEAAARTLADPSHDRIQGLVQKMINKVFASGELDECELTLKDLHLIAKCFTRVLSGIYHQRIAYFEPAEKVNEKSLSKAAKDEEDQEQNSDEAKGVEGLGSQKRCKPQSDERVGKEDNKEDLKRLGI